jgi:hypothetical protein
MKIVRETINEGYISDIPKEDILSKDLDKNINDYIGDLETYGYVYKYENPDKYEDLTDSEVTETEDFKNWIEYEIEYRYNNIIDKLSDLADINGRIKIWRVLAVDNNWLNHLKKEGLHLGIYWSYEKDVAEAHWGYNKDTNLYARIESSVDEKHVNWIDTIKANLNFATGDEEKEIRLFKGTLLKIENLEINLKKQNISDIKNKIFKA